EVRIDLAFVGRVESALRRGPTGEPQAPARGFLNTTPSLALRVRQDVGPRRASTRPTKTDTRGPSCPLRSRRPTRSTRPRPGRRGGRPPTTRGAASGPPTCTTGPRSGPAA